ncbi:MAG TPA: 6-phosphogluconolactonase [Burkholderiales bacterium]|nr:6-phosphogluconolactonase [Burkholderiales bacterium]
MISCSNQVGWNWRIFQTSEDLIDAAAANILGVANDAILSSGAFHFVATGGETALKLYEKLGGMSSQWDKWRIYFGDERCLPRNDPERNSVMLRKSLLACAPIPESQIYEIPADLGPEAGSRAYVATQSRVPRFDLVLLSLGVDGHIASLFDAHHADMQASTSPVLPVWSAPKPPAERISLSLGRLAQTNYLLCLAAGAAKRDAVTRWLDGKGIVTQLSGDAVRRDVFVEHASWPHD